MLRTDFRVLFEDTIKYQFEPVCITLRGFLNVPPQFLNAHPFPTINFVRIWHRLTVIASNKDVVQLVLKQVIIQIGMIDKAEKLSQFAIETHLLIEPPSRRTTVTFTGLWMTTARIRPQPTGVILCL